MLGLGLGSSFGSLFGSFGLVSESQVKVLFTRVCTVYESVYKRPKARMCTRVSVYIYIYIMSSNRDTLYTGQFVIYVSVPKTTCTLRHPVRRQTSLAE